MPAALLKDKNGVSIRFESPSFVWYIKGPSVVRDQFFLAQNLARGAIRLRRIPIFILCNRKDYVRCALNFDL